MQFPAFALFAASALFYSNVTTTEEDVYVTEVATEVVTEPTNYCPEPTTLTIDDRTYTMYLYD